MEDAIYSPILPAKAGEIAAIGALTSFAEVRTRPMLDVPKPRGEKMLAEHLASIAESIARNWGGRLPIFTDFSRFEPNVEIDGISFVEYFFKIARQCKIKAIPVGGPPDLRGPGTAYLDSVANVAKRDGYGIAIRIPHEYILALDDLAKVIDESLRSVAVNEKDVDLFLDGGSLENLPAKYRIRESLVVTFANALSVLTPRGFRSIAFGGSSIPKVVPYSKEWQAKTISRAEYAAWESVVTTRSLSRLRFLDYGITFANYVDPTGPVIPPSRIRLTTGASHHLFKAPRDDHRALCEQVTKQDAYSMQESSWGKYAVRDCAIGQSGVGIPKDWVAHDTNMHIENTVSQIDRLLCDMKGYEQLRFAAELPKAVLQELLV